MDSGCSSLTPRTSPLHPPRGPSPCRMRQTACSCAVSDRCVDYISLHSCACTAIAILHAAVSSPQNQSQLLHSKRYQGSYRHTIQLKPPLCLTMLQNYTCIQLCCSLHASCRMHCTGCFMPHAVCHMLENLQGPCLGIALGGQVTFSQKVPSLPHQTSIAGSSCISSRVAL